MGEHEGMTKIHIDLPVHWAAGGESLWARSLGGDLYEIDNTPFYAYGINYRDVVRAVARNAEKQPEVFEVVRPSGHRTLRCFFADDLATERRDGILAQLIARGVTYEGISAHYVALDIPRPSITARS